VLDDGMLLTENVAIIDWISGQWPVLLPDGRLGRTRHLQVLAFLSTEVHKPFIPLFFLENEAEQARLREILAQRFRWIASRLEGDFLFDRFTGADAFLYVMLRWAAMVGLDAPRSFQAFVEAVERRGSVKAVLATEGLQPLCADAVPSPAT
jgi:glutathione S-transferase